MILGVAFFAKLLLVAIAAYFIWKESISLNKTLRGGLLLILLLVAGLAQGLAYKLPPLTDELRLMALGSKNPQAQAEEIFIKGLQVDGQAVEIDKPVAGKWFWAGTNYAWRIETDTRQPKGNTRSITLAVPVGQKRSVEFVSDSRKGRVRLEAGGRAWVADTFSATQSTQSVPIGRSVTALLLQDQVRRLALYCLVLSAATAVMLALLRLYLKDRVAAALWLRRNGGRLTYGALALTTFGLMEYYADGTSLWYDEVCRIGITKGSIREAIGYCYRFRAYEPPLFEICGTIWYHIAPYGQRWLFLMNTVSVAISIFVLGCLTERVASKYCGLLASAFMAFSIPVWVNIAHEYGGYSLFLLFSTLSLYCFARRFEIRGPKKWRFFYGISLACMSMSHYFGMLCVAALFVVDCFLYFCNKTKHMKLGDYSFAAAISIVWLFLVWRKVLRHIRPEDKVAYCPVPDPANLQYMLKHLSGLFDPVYWLFIGGLIVGAITLFKILNRDGDEAEWVYASTIILTVGTLAGMFLYGNFINSKSTLWLPRYFTGLIPYSCFITALGANYCLNHIKASTEAKSVLCLTIIFIVGLNCVSTAPWREVVPGYNMRAAANWLYTRVDDIYRTDTLVLTTLDPAPLKGYYEYYVTKQGRRDNIPVSTAGNSKAVGQRLLSYRRVYIQNLHNRLSPWIKNVLDTHYILKQDIKAASTSIYERR